MPVKRILQRLLGRGRPAATAFAPSPKYVAEMAFRQQVLRSYVQWYRGEIEALYETKAPLDHQKVRVRSERHSAILTYLELHQKPKYLDDLDLNSRALEGLRVLDVGSGPMPSALAFRNIQLYCLDPLLPAYIEIGFPLHYYDNVRFVHGFSENMPLETASMDVVLSVNAIDHVDDFGITAEEIRRVLKPGGKVRMHIHYHKKTATEPIELDDGVVQRHYAWCEGFKKVKESRRKHGEDAAQGELFTVWSNF